MCFKNGKSEGFGLLSNGFLFKCSISLCRTLISSESNILELIGKKISYEISIGLNGRIWVNSSSPKNIILISNTILASEDLTDSQMEILVKKAFSSVNF